MYLLEKSPKGYLIFRKCMFIYSAERLRVKRKGKVKLEEQNLDRYREDREEENGGKRPRNGVLEKNLKRG